MRKNLCASVLFAGLVCFSVSLAAARFDVKVQSEKDPKGNVVYKLVNSGAKNVKAKVRYRKDCSSTTTSKEPTFREYWVPARSSLHLRKVMASSDCRHDYRIVSAEYN